MVERSVFWDDLDENFLDPEFKRRYVLDSQRIAAIDRIVNDLNDLRDQLGMTKADLARAVDRTPEAVRRLFTAKTVNPELGFIAELAAALGHEVVLRPMSDAKQAKSAQALRDVTSA